MNITVVSHYYPPHLGGLERVAYYQATLLAKRGHNVIVVTSAVGKSDSLSNEDGVKVVRVKVFNFFEKWGIPFPIFFPSLCVSLHRAIKSADVVHIHDVFYMSSFAAAVCARWHKKPVVVMQHVAMIEHPSTLVMVVQKLVYLTSGKFIFNTAGKIITINDRVEKFILNSGVSTKKLVQLVNGVDVEQFCTVSASEKAALRKKFGLDETRKIVLFVGRLVPKKGYKKLLKAQSDFYQIVFCGGTIAEETNRNVIFLGERPVHEVAQAYQAADIFVLPSEDEGFPLSVQEAMSVGLPIVTTNDEGYKRYNLDPNNVCLLDNPTADSVREVITSLIHNDEKLQHMSDYSKNYAASHFDWEHVVTNLVEIYEGLLKTKIV